MLTKTLTSVFVVAVVLNYGWELAQAPLYVGLQDYDAGVFWHCFVASLGDGVMVLLIVAAGWVTFQRPDWFLRPGVSGYLIMIISGLFLAILVEWVAVHILQRWEYTPMMPELPWLDIGIVPIAQMVLLPVATFRIVSSRIGSR
jgi:hypothetical protein